MLLHFLPRPFLQRIAWAVSNIYHAALDVASHVIKPVQVDRPARFVQHASNNGRVASQRIITAHLIAGVIRVNEVDCGADCETFHEILLLLVFPATFTIYQTSSRPNFRQRADWYIIECGVT